MRIRTGKERQCRVEVVGARIVLDLLWLPLIGMLFRVLLSACLTCDKVASPNGVVNK